NRNVTGVQTCALPIYLHDESNTNPSHNNRRIYNGYHQGDMVSGKHSHSRNQPFHSLYSANKPAHKAAYFIFSLIHETIGMLLSFILSYVVGRQHGFLFEISLNDTIMEVVLEWYFWKRLKNSHDHS